jgi:hypothetical protein
MTDMTSQIEILTKRADNTTRVLDNHGDVIIDLIAKFNRQEKIIAELQTTVKNLSTKPTLKRKAESISESKEKKTKVSNLRDEYIERLKNGRNKSKEWEPGMSKYTSVSYNNQINKWFWISNIFEGNVTFFKSRNMAEKHYENILTKYNIPIEYIIRRGYDESQDLEEEDAEDDD